MTAGLSWGRLSELFEKKMDPLDFQIMIAIETLKATKVEVVQDDIAQIVKRSAITVNRRIKKLKQQNILQIERISSHKWRYTIQYSRLEDSAPDVASKDPLWAESSKFLSSGPMSFSAHKSSLSALSFFPQELEESGTSFLISRKGEEWTIIPLSGENCSEIEKMMAHQNSDGPVYSQREYQSSKTHKVHLESNLDNKHTISSSKEDLVSFRNSVDHQNSDNPVCYSLSEVQRKFAEGKDMSKIIGPSSSLRSELESILVSGKKVARKSKTPVEKLESLEKRQERARQRFESKSPSEYNCTDLEIIWQDSWEECFKYSPKRWLGKEKSLVKRLYEDVGADEVARVFGFVIQHWEDLAKYYRLKGKPTIGMVSVYWNSWVSDSIQGIPKAKKWESEYQYDGTDNQSQNGRFR